MIRLTKDREKVHNAMAELCEQLAGESYSDEGIAAHTNAMLERMRLRQLN
jgi:hypothetical protein